MSAPHSAYWYPTLVLASVTGVLTQDATNPQMLFDALPIDNHQSIHQMPWATTPGVVRRPRKGMMAAVMYVSGSPRGAVALGHIFNKDSFHAYADPMPRDIIPRVDDFAVYHDETGGFLRFRNVNSTAKVAGPDGSAGEVELSMRSGFDLKVTEYQDPPLPPQPPGNPIPVPVPPPIRAKATLTMPFDGLTLVIDQPAPGDTTVSLTMLNGVTLTIDAAGNVSLVAPTVTIDSPDVNIGGVAGNELAFKSDVEALKTAYDAHTHLGVTTGSGVSGVPQTPAPAPVGTVHTKAL